MGVYIKGMEMPKSCTVCPFENFGDCYGGKVKAIMDIDDYVSAGKRHPRCPLVHVPAHGDLIDRKALLADTTDMLHSMMVFGGARVYTSDAIKNAPTIIPAEEGE